LADHLRWGELSGVVNGVGLEGPQVVLQQIILVRQAVFGRAGYRFISEFLPSIFSHNSILQFLNGGNEWRVDAHQDVLLLEVRE